MLNKQISLRTLLLILTLLIIPLIIVGCDDQTTASNNNATTAAQKWGSAPNITNFYEYQQVMQIYQMRDNPNLVLNAYLFSDQTGQLTCLGRVKGFGVPYGTEQSPPSTSTQSAVPEPNGLYPSQNTNADWIQLIDPATGKVYVTFVEPNLLITQVTLPCKPLSA